MIKVEFWVTNFEDSQPALTQQQSDYYKNAIMSVIKKLSEGLNLSHLEAIIVPQNYKEELFDFQQQKGIRVGYTENDMGVGHAMALTYNENGEYKSTIFISKIIAFPFVQEELLNSLEEDVRIQFIEARNKTINHIHHELVHVHESSLLKKAFLNEKVDTSSDMFINDLRLLAQMVWSEYYACRLSSSTCTDIADEIDNLLKQALLAKEKADEKIEEYKHHGDIDKLVQEVYSSLQMILNYSAYLHGKLYMLDTDYRLECISKINELLKETFIFDTWVTIGEDLNNLFESFPNWLERDVFDPFGQTIQGLINRLGVFPEATLEGIYYSVPT